MQAAHNGDERGFLAKMSVDTQRARADADAAGSKLIQAQKDLQAALDERFGKGLPGRGQQARISDLKTVLSRLVNVELIAVEQKTPTEARLRLKTISKGSGNRTATEEDTLPAVKEGDEWKLDLAQRIRGIIQTLDRRVAAYAHVVEVDRNANAKRSHFPILS